MSHNLTEKNPLPTFLTTIKETIFDRLGLPITKLELEPESAEYDACHFQIPNLHIWFRKAKITPKKIGQFVTLWKRSKEGSIEPFHTKDDMDYCIISTNQKNRIGYFLFTKLILSEKGILTGKKEGKRGFRVYPAWDKPTNKQGATTQYWQLPFFIETTGNQNDLDSIAKLLEIQRKR